MSDRSGIGREECEAFLKDQKEPTLEIFVQINNAVGVLLSDFIETGRRDAVQRKIEELPLKKQKKLFEEIKKIFALNSNI